MTPNHSRSLESCAYSANVFKETLNKIQKAVDDLSLRQYSNLHAWVGKLDEAVESKLAMRLQVTSCLGLPGSTILLIEFLTFVLI